MRHVFWPRVSRPPVYYFRDVYEARIYHLLLVVYPTVGKSVDGGSGAQHGVCPLFDVRVGL